MAFRKSVGVLIVSVGGGILSAGHRETKSVAKERRKMCVIENGRMLQHVCRLCMLQLKKRIYGHVASYFPTYHVESSYEGSPRKLRQSFLPILPNSQCKSLSEVWQMQVSFIQARVG